MRCAVLFTGGLDGQLTVRLLQAQQIDVTAVCFRSAWDVASRSATVAADTLGVPLRILSLEEGYGQRLRQPRLGLVGGAAPCLDCRIAMLAGVRGLLHELGWDFVATGDVVGQRARSSIRDLEIVDYHAGLEGCVVRPLSARLLLEGEPEQRGWVHRAQLFDWQGKSRRPQEQLARQFGLPLVPPRPDCPLLAGPLAERALALVRAPQSLSAWDLALLPIGRHQWLDASARVIVGRDQAENERLTAAAADPTEPPVALLTPLDFAGPTALLIGAADEANVQRAAELLARYSRHLPPAPQIQVQQGREIRTIELSASP